MGGLLRCRFCWLLRRGLREPTLQTDHQAALAGLQELHHLFAALWAHLRRQRLHDTRDTNDVPVAWCDRANILASSEQVRSRSVRSSPCALGYWRCARTLVPTIARMQRSSRQECVKRFAQERAGDSTAGLYTVELEWTSKPPPMYATRSVVVAAILAFLLSACATSTSTISPLRSGFRVRSA